MAKGTLALSPGCHSLCRFSFVNLVALKGLLLKM